MDRADPYADATMARLTRDARAVALLGRGVLGLTVEDLVSAGWLAYVAAAERGLGHPGCAQRARFAMVDAMRAWIGTPWCHRTGEALVTHVPMPPEVVAPTVASHTRTRLPRRVRRAIRTLPPRCREALHCMTVRGWSLAHTAEHMRVSVGSVGRLRHEAIRHLRAAAGASSDT